MNHEFRKGPKPKVPAEIVGPELERIWKKNGKQLIAPDVVDEARPKTAVLHPCFEWDNKVAAEAHRLSQARLLIRTVRIVNPVEDGGGTRPQFVSVDDAYGTKLPSRRFYQHSSVLPERPGEYMSALAEAQARLAEAAEAFSDLQRLAPGDHSDINMHKIGLIIEALNTAKKLAERLQ
jgi:hypothetical protein